MNIRKIKNRLACFVKTPLHPQWLLSRHADSSCQYIAKEINNDVLDIGCGHKAIKDYLDKKVVYHGLDYYQTAKNWYACVPDLYGDAQSLPIASESVSNVLLLDVLEHLPAPQQCVKEVARILIPNGKLILQVPFLYPLHDVPLDFHRWTKYGFENLFKDTGLTVIAIDSTGKPIETAGVMLNIALCKMFINAMNDKDPRLLLLLFVPLLVPIINIVCFLLASFSAKDCFMPLNYRVIAIKSSI